MGRILGKAGVSLTMARDGLRRVDQQFRQRGERSAAAPWQAAGDRPDSTDRDTEPFSVEDDDS